MMKWPSTDCFGRQVKEGDLVLLSNDGTPFVAYLDSKNAAFVRHATLSVQELAKWGCKPESPKILSEKVAGEVSGC